MEHLSILSTLTAGMAHEIRNPLSGIRGSAQLLLKDLENIEQREYIEIVIAEVDRINRLVKRMMDLTRPALKNFKPTNIHQVLEEILALEKEILKKKGHIIEEYIRYSDEINSKNLYSKLKVGLLIAWNHFSYKSILRLVDNFKQDIVHVHNTFPLISPSIFYAVRKKAAMIGHLIRGKLA